MSRSGVGGYTWAGSKPRSRTCSSAKPPPLVCSPWGRTGLASDSSRLFVLLGDSVTRSRWPVAAVGVVAVLAVLTVLDGQERSRAAADQIAGSLRLSAEVAAPGSVIEARGRVASESKRRVVLQRSVGGPWKSVAAGRSTRRGRYELVTRLPQVQATVVRYRVYVPRWTRGRRVLPRGFTRTDSVRTSGATPTTAGPSPTATSVPSPSPSGTATPAPSPTPAPSAEPAGRVTIARWEMDRARRFDPDAR